MQQEYRAFSLFIPLAIFQGIGWQHKTMKHVGRDNVGDGISRDGDSIPGVSGRRWYCWRSVFEIATQMWKGRGRKRYGFCGL